MYCNLIHFDRKVNRKILRNMSGNPAASFFTVFFYSDVFSSENLPLFVSYE